MMLSKSPLVFLAIIFCINLQISLVHSWWSKSGGGSQRSHDIGNKNELRNLYNQKVKTIERVHRPMGLPIVEHQGVRVTTENGKKYLIHNGPNYGGKGGNTVVVDAKHMSNKWSVSRSNKAKSGVSIGDLVKAGEAGYNVALDNCYHSATRMEKKAGKR